MSDEAPTVIASVEYPTEGDGSQRGHYVYAQPGSPVTLDRHVADQTDANAVSVLSTCCSTNMGNVDPTSAATLAKWIDQGVFFTCNIKDPPSVVSAYNDIMVTVPLVIRCVPIKSTKINISSKKEKELEDA